MTLPDESRNVYWKIQEIWNWLVHPPQNGILPHGMCYSHYGNGVRNGAISIAQWGLLSDCYKVNPIGQ